MDENSLPLIVEIKRGSHEDGPGIRTVVFFKGCPLRCVFCHNPETQDPSVDIVFSADTCRHCQACAETCVQGAIDLSRPGRIDRDRCVGCGQCVRVCPGKGLRQIGTHYPVESLVQILMRDVSFYRHSGGGVTLSGGECTLYPHYLESLLKNLKARQLHIALETCGYFSYAVFRRKIVPYVDLIYFDLKIADPEAHQTYTGRKNHRILRNLEQLMHERPEIVHARIALIPGITDTRENLTALVDLLHDAGVQKASLLPYNPLGIATAKQLGKRQASLPEKWMTPEEEEAVHMMFREILACRKAKGPLGLKMTAQQDACASR